MQTTRVFQNYLAWVQLVAIATSHPIPGFTWAKKSTVQQLPVSVIHLRRGELIIACKFGPVPQMSFTVIVPHMSFTVAVPQMSFTVAVSQI
jgi:hypothetical protein